MEYTMPTCQITEGSLCRFWHTLLKLSSKGVSLDSLKSFLKTTLTPNFPARGFKLLDTVWKNRMAAKFVTTCDFSFLLLYLSNLVITDVKSSMEIPATNRRSTTSNIVNATSWTQDRSKALPGRVLTIPYTTDLGWELRADTKGFRSFFSYLQHNPHEHSNFTSMYCKTPFDGCSTVKASSGRVLRFTFLPDNKHPLSRAHIRISQTYLHTINSPLSKLFKWLAEAEEDIFIFNLSWKGGTEWKMLLGPSGAQYVFLPGSKACALN